VSTESSNRIYQEDLAYVHDAGFGDLARGAAPAILAALRLRDFLPIPAFRSKSEVVTGN